MLTFPGASSDILEKFQHQIQDTIDPKGTHWAVMCVNRDIQADIVPDVAFQSAMLCIKFDERIYQYRDITNKLIQIGDRADLTAKQIHVVLNVFEDLYMLKIDDGLIMPRHIECFFGAILRAIAESKKWMAELEKMENMTVYSYIGPVLHEMAGTPDYVVRNIEKKENVVPVKKEVQ